MSTIDLNVLFDLEEKTAERAGNKEYHLFKIYSIAKVDVLPSLKEGDSPF